MNAAQFDRAMNGALNYALSDKSDPFAAARAITHTKNGVANIEGDKDRCYSAERASEQRFLPSGEAYSVVVFKNAARP